MVDRWGRQQQQKKLFVLLLAAIKCLEKTVLHFYQQVRTAYIPIALIPKSVDLPIFMVTDRQTDKPITLPLAHVCRAMALCNTHADTHYVIS